MRLKITAETEKNYVCPILADSYTPIAVKTGFSSLSYLFVSSFPDLRGWL